jgi:hypothetical protein
MKIMIALKPDMPSSSEKLGLESEVRTSVLASTSSLVISAGLGGQKVG